MALLDKGMILWGGQSGQREIVSCYSEQCSVEGLGTVYFWNFPFNIFGLWVTETIESETAGKGRIRCIIYEFLLLLIHA